MTDVESRAENLRSRQGPVKDSYRTAPETALITGLACSGDMLLEALAGFRDIRLFFDLETDESQDRVDTLLRLTDRYCVVGQTITAGAPLHLASGPAPSAS